MIAFYFLSALVNEKKHLVSIVLFFQIIFTEENLEIGGH